MSSNNGNSSFPEPAGIDPTRHHYSQCMGRVQNKAKREMLIGILSIELATILSGMLFGSHLGVFPINVLFYLFASTVFTLGRKSESLQAASALSSPEVLGTQTANA